MKQGWHPYEFEGWPEAEKDYEFYDTLWLNGVEVALLQCFRTDPNTVFLLTMAPNGTINRTPHIRIDEGRTLADVKKIAEIECGLRPKTTP